MSNDDSQQQRSSLPAWSIEFRFLTSLCYRQYYLQRRFLIPRRGQNDSFGTFKSIFCGGNLPVSRARVTRLILRFYTRRNKRVGLASIIVACNTRRVKQALLWLSRRKDEYFHAWQAWAFRGSTLASTDGVSPIMEQKRQLAHVRRTPGNMLHRLLSPWLAPSFAAPNVSQEMCTADIVSRITTAISWSTPDEWVVELEQPLPRAVQPMTSEEEAFWPTYYWTDNPWIVDHQG